MEKNPGTPAEPERDDFDHSSLSDKDSTKKKRRRVGSAAAASTTSEAATPAEQAPETQRKTPSALELALAQLATETRRQKAAEQTPETSDETTHKSDHEESDETEAATQSELEGEATPELENTAEVGEESDETYEPLTDYGIDATEFSGGEVVIDLGGDSVEEHVLPLEPSEAPLTAESHVPAAVQAHDFETMAAEAAALVPEAEVVAASPEAVADSNLEPLPTAVPTETTAVQPVPTAETLAAAYQNPNEAPTHAPQPEVAYLQQQNAAESFGFMTPPPNVAPATPHFRSPEAGQPINKADFDDAIYRATKTGQNRGVAAGLMVGAGYEHFKHKRREKKAAKKHHETTKKLAEARKTLAFTAEQQTKQRAEYTAQADEANQKLATTERRISELERQRQLHQVAEQPTVPAANMPKTHAEKVPQPAVQPEVLPVAPEHRLQTSSWHSIEVDAHTGRAVEKPVFEYGHEYYREQAQENALGLPPAQDSTERKTPAPAHDTSNAAAPFGGSSLPPMYSGPQQPAPPTSRPTRPQPKPVQSQTASIPPATKNVAKPTQPAAPIWPLVLALLVVVICLSLVLR